MALPIWNAEVYGNVVLLIDETTQEIALASETAARKKLGAPIKGEWNASNVETLGKVIRFYEGQGYKTAKGMQWSPEGTDLASAKPVLKATKYAQPCIHWVAPSKAPGPVSNMKAISFSQAELMRILGENPGKAKPKKK